MRTSIALLLLTAGGALDFVSAGDWKPAAGPLSTRWAKDVRPDNVWPEYPRPQMVRPEWQNLNGLWQFGVAKPDEAPPLGRTLDEQILVPFPVESALSGVMRSAERVWYRRTFSIPAAWSDNRVLLHFGAVDWEATVWVNGRELDKHRGGYDPFEYDITDALKPSGDQELVVRVFDPSDAGTQPRGKQVEKPHGIWYTPTTGIWQTVWLEPVPMPVHVGTIRAVPDLKAGKIRVTVGLGRPLRPLVPVRIAVLDGEQVIATAAGKDGHSIEVAIPNPRPWSPSDPFLYGLKVSMSWNGQEDTVESYFGMRDIAVGKDRNGVTRLLLNGEPLFQFGPLDQGFWPDGLYTAPCDAAMRYDLEVTRRLGFNMVRKHVKVEPDRWYYWCDKLGLLVWQDMPSGDASVAPGQGEITRTPESARQFEAELTGMIKARWSHPSIVMWVVFNEGWGQYETARFANRVHVLDPSRLVCGASGWNDVPAGDVHDIHVYPGPGATKPEERRAAVLGEFGGLGLPLAGHTWQNEKNWGYRNLKTTDELNDGYLKLLADLLPLIGEPGLSAAVYTQTTDVEIEVNGVMTYDREVVKLDEKRSAAAAAKLYETPRQR